MANGLAVGLPVTSTANGEGGVPEPATPTSPSGRGALQDTSGPRAVEAVGWPIASGKRWGVEEAEDTGVTKREEDGPPSP